MNKRDLIKALFKDPTIKALYESGHFNPTDINRAILTEAARPDKLIRHPLTKKKVEARELIEIADINSLYEGDLFAELTKNPKVKKLFLQLGNLEGTSQFIEKGLKPLIEITGFDEDYKKNLLAILDEYGLDLTLGFRELYEPLHKKFVAYGLIAKYLKNILDTPSDTATLGREAKSAYDNISQAGMPDDSKYMTIMTEIERRAHPRDEKPIIFSMFELPASASRGFTIQRFLEMFGDEVKAILEKVERERSSDGEKTDAAAETDNNTDQVDSSVADSENSGDETTSDTSYSPDKKKEYMSLTKLIIRANGLINKPEFVEKQKDFLKSLDDTNFLKELVKAYLTTAKRTPETNEALGLIKKYAADSSIKPLQQQIAKLKASLDKIQGKSTTPSEEPSNVSVNKYVDGLAKTFDETVPRTLQQKLSEIVNSPSQESSIAKAFIMYAVGSKENLQEVEEAGQADLFMSQKVDPFVTAAGLTEKADEIKTFLKDLTSNEKIQDLHAEINKVINSPQGDVPADDSTEEDLEQKRQQLANRASAALSVLNVKDSELLKNDVFMIFMGSVLEKEGVIREVEEQLESYVDKYLPQLENEESRKEFYITADEVGELKTFLEANKSEVDKIITAAIKSTKDNKDPNMDDESPPDPSEFQEKWTEELQTFFGKNPKKSSFMRRLLLSSQAEMLYNILATLEEIADPAQMAALTDMNQDDEKENQAEKQLKQETFVEALKLDTTVDGIKKSKEDPRTIKRNTDPVDRYENFPPPPADWLVDDDEKEFDEKTLETDQAASVKKALEDYAPDKENQDKIELPEENKRIIKQDLQSMVDLLRQLKKAISSYSTYSTQKSVDPRFDGSKLKANMDGLLTQVQDDVYDLYSNLKPPAPKATPEPQDGDNNLEEALNGIMLEEADPERQEQIKFVREVYDNAKQEYIYSLATSMEGGKWSKSQQSAKKILEILKDDKFISMFPTGMKTSSGRVMTVGKAYESMKEVIQDFIETVRDIVLISKTRYVSRTSLTQARNNLLQISTRIADLFRVASKLPPEEIKKAKEAEAADPKNQALTPESAENLEQAPEDNSAGGSDDVAQDEEDAEVEEQPAIQPFFDLIFKQNQRESPNKEIIEKIEATFSDEEDQLKAKQIFSYFLLYSLPEKINEADDSDDDDDDFFGVNWDDPVFAFYSKLSKNSKTPESLKVFLKGNRLNLIDTDGILRFKTPEEILGAAGNELALFRTLEQNPAMQKFIASLKGESSDDETLDKSDPATDNDSDTLQESLEKSLRPIIEKMLNEHYNH